MVTLSPHLPALATLLTASPGAVLHAAGSYQAATSAASGLTMTLIVLAATVLAVISRAIRGVVALLSQFLQMAAAAAGVLVIMLIAIVVAVAVLAAHH
jgi:hypothetical protein